MKKICGWWLAILLSGNTFAVGVSPYLPLKMAPEFEHLVESLLAVTSNADVLTKPYKAVDIHRLLPQIKDSHPDLHYRISGYIKRYKKTAGKTHSKVTLSASSHDKQLPNQRGQTTDNWIQAEGMGFIELNPYLYLNVGTVINDKDRILTNSILSFGYHYAQVDIGYREHWYSPFYDSAMLMSNNAKTAPSITISNHLPITDLRIRYELFAAKLDEQQIRIDNSLEQGQPYLAGMHISISPTEKLTLGFSRLMQFGGTKNGVDSNEIWRAIFSEVDGNETPIDQLAAISAKFNSSILGMDFSAYFEYAKEGTESSFDLSPSSNSVGLFLPSIGSNSSLRVELSDIDANWYSHSAYTDGNRNDSRVIGHWVGDLLQNNTVNATKNYSAEWNWGFSDSEIISTTLRVNETQHNEINGQKQRRGYEIKTRYSKFIKDAFWGVELYAGEAIYDKEFLRLSIFYSW